MLIDIKNGISKKIFIKRLNYQLERHFFSLQEIKTLRVYQIKKIIKTISKIEKIKLSRKEIKEIAKFLVSSNFEKPSKSISKLWKFAKLFKAKTKRIIVKLLFVKIILFYLSSYWTDKFELMRN